MVNKSTFLIFGIVLLIFVSSGCNDSKDRIEKDSFSKFNYYNNYYTGIHGITGKCYTMKTEETGKSRGNHTLPVDIYLVNSKNFSDEKLYAVIEETNLIWGNYGIQFNINNKPRLPYDSKPIVQPNDEAEDFVFDIVGERLYWNDDKIFDIILVNDDLYNKPLKKILFWDYTKIEKLEAEGIYLDCFGNCTRDVEVVVVSTKAKNVSWVLAHEFGHILGLLDENLFKPNLMVKGGCVKLNYYPTVLNQSQVDKVHSRAKELGY